MSGSSCPTHPGFGGTARPEALTSIRDLAALYVALLGPARTRRRDGRRELYRRVDRRRDGPAASPRVSGAILVDAVGIEVPGHPVADFFSLTMDQVFQAQLPQPRTVPHRPRHTAAGRAGHPAGNRAALATYAGRR